MSFQQGLSGLNSTAKALDTIGNNVSNAGTVGFKSATAQFADVFAASLSGGGASQIGIGSGLARVAQNFTQGNITNTNNPLDIAINGSGFYRMTNSSGTITYSRAGQFQLDKAGYIANSAGLKLTGYAADPTTGTISPGSLVPLQVVNTNIAPKVTSASQMQLNLDSRAMPPAAMSSGSLTGAATLAQTTTIGATNDELDLIVDGHPITVQIPHKAYAASEIVNTLESLINSALSVSGASVSVSSTSGGQLLITSDSKGTVGSAAEGSFVQLDGLGGTAANLLLGAPVKTDGLAANPPVVPVATAGTFIGGRTLPSSVTLGSGESFSLTVDGVTQTITLNAGTYTTTGAPPSQLQAALQAAITAKFPGPPAPTVVAASGGPLIITSGTTGAASTVLAEDMTAGIEPLFGPTAVDGEDNFNTITARTSGSLTSGIALTTPNITGAPAANNVLNVTVDGVPVSATLTVNNYDGTAGNTLTDLASDVEAKINQELINAGSTSRVTVTLSSNKLIVSSNTQGLGSTVELTDTGGSAAVGLFNYGDPTNPPVTLAGNQTQGVNPLGFTASTAQTVYDSQGNPHNLSLYFVKTSQGNVWQMYSTLDNAQQEGPLTLSFNGSGALQTPMPITLPDQGKSYTFKSTATNATRPDDLQFTLDLSGTTQYGVNFTVNTLSQDGYSSGQLSGISVGANGIIQGRFSNGQSKNMGQIILVSFNNPNGLQSLGSNQWAETTESGQPIPGAPGTGSLGLIQSAAVEESNVDLTKELVDMITQQRVYQANAQTIKTQDQVLQTLVNLR